MEQSTRYQSLKIKYIADNIFSVFLYKYLAQTPFLC